MANFQAKPLIFPLLFGAGFALPSIDIHTEGKLSNRRYNFVAKGCGSRLTGAKCVNRYSTLRLHSDIKRFSINNVLRGGKLDGFTSDIIENLAAIDHFESLLCTSRSAIEKAFRSIDLDDSGHISTVELQSALSALGVNATQSEVETIFDRLDDNKDGGIDFEEFERGVSRAIARRTGWLGDQLNIFSQPKPPPHHATNADSANNATVAPPPPPPRLWRSPWAAAKERLLDDIAENDRQKESSRQFLRTVFSERDWVRFRSSARLMDHLGTFSSSSVLRGLRLQLGAVAAVAAGVLAANAGLARLAGGAFGAGWRVALPMAPFALASPALCLLLVFRTNAAYARWTEARAAVGDIKNRCRDLVRQGVTWLPAGDREAMVRRVCALARMIRRHLRNNPDNKAEEEETLHADLTDLLGRAEADRLVKAAHPPLAGLVDLSLIVKRAAIDVKASDRFEAALTAINSAVGACERILRAPTPLVYTRHTSRFLLAWCLLLPFGLYTELKGSLLVVPIVVALAAFLFGIEELGVQIEEPFSIIAIESIFDSTQVNMIDMYHQSLIDNGAGAPGRPPDIGSDARRLWNPASEPPAAGHGHRLGANSTGIGGDGGLPVRARPPLSLRRCPSGLLDGAGAGEGGDIDAA